MPLSEDSLHLRLTEEHPNRVSPEPSLLSHQQQIQRLVQELGSTCACAFPGTQLSVGNCQVSDFLRFASLI